MVERRRRWWCVVKRMVCVRSDSFEAERVERAVIIIISSSILWDLVCFGVISTDLCLYIFCFVRVFLTLVHVQLDDFGLVISDFCLVNFVFVI